MRREYDFGKATRNPHARRLDRQATIRIDEATIDRLDISGQPLIDPDLRERAETRKRPSPEWIPDAAVRE